MMINAGLIESFAEPCVMLVKKRVSDGQGGFETSWADGDEFSAAIVKDQSLQAQAAEKQGVTGVYTITTPTGVGLEYHEVFRRVADGTTFRVTSDYTDSKPPDVATFAFEQVKAERWELPT